MMPDIVGFWFGEEDPGAVMKVMRGAGTSAAGGIDKSQRQL